MADDACGAVRSWVASRRPLRAAEKAAGESWKAGSSGTTYVGRMPICGTFLGFAVQYAVVAPGRMDRYRPRASVF